MLVVHEAITMQNAVRWEPSRWEDDYLARNHHRHHALCTRKTRRRSRRARPRVPAGAVAWERGGGDSGRQKRKAWWSGRRLICCPATSHPASCATRLRGAAARGRGSRGAGWPLCHLGRAEITKDRPPLWMDSWSWRRNTGRSATIRSVLLPSEILLAFEELCYYQTCEMMFGNEKMEGEFGKGKENRRSDHSFTHLFKSQPFTYFSISILSLIFHKPNQTAAESLMMDTFFIFKLMLLFTSNINFNYLFY